MHINSTVISGYFNGGDGRDELKIELKLSPNSYSWCLHNGSFSIDIEGNQSTFDNIESLTLSDQESGLFIDIHHNLYKRSIEGGMSDDIILLDKKADTAKGFEGNDWFKSSAENAKGKKNVDIIYGGSGSDVFDLTNENGKLAYKASAKKDYMFVKDFDWKEDSVHLGTNGSLKFKSKSKSVFIYKKKDLIAKISMDSNKNAQNAFKKINSWVI